MDGDEAAFLAGIRAEPRDDLRRLVYADWLDEQADDECRTKAEYLRLEVHVSSLPDEHPERDGHILRLRAVAVKLSLEWKEAVAKVSVENCGVRWRFQCPKKWDQMEPIRDEVAMRFCTACRRVVMYCRSVEGARRIAETDGHCVVIDLGVRRKSGDMDMLRSPPELESDYHEMAGEIINDDFNPGAPGYTPPPPANAGLLRRLWRKLTGR